MNQKLFINLTSCSRASKKKLSTFFDDLLRSPIIQTTTASSEFNTLNQIFVQNTSELSLNKARQISKQQRNQKLMIDHQFNYGQITFHSIYKLFSKIKQIRSQTKTNFDNQIFYDLGSGSGKAVFGAALCYPFMQCIGIQYLETLCKISQKNFSHISAKHQLIENTIHQKISYNKQIFKLPELIFRNQDFKTTNWDDGTVIFVSSTCFSKQLMKDIGNLCKKLKKGTIIVTMTKKLESHQQIKLVESFDGTTSWGNSRIFIHMKQQ